jgi:murein DD-endopeptidase MepM/ murein hydrolase activator NlpD
MLPQKPAPRPRKMTLQRLVVWSALPALGVVAAFGVMPQTITGAGKTRVLVQEITLPKVAPVANASTFWRYDEAQKGDTVKALLHRLNVDDPAAENYLRVSRTAASFRRLAPGVPVQAETAADGSLLALRYADAGGGQTLVERSGDGFALRALPAQLERRIFMRTGEIRTTLFDATDAAGLPDPAANQLADIFGSNIDFHHDLVPGDTFAVIYEVSYSNGQPVSVGRVLAAEFVNRGRMYRALYYGNGDHGNYYSPEGNSMRRTFLRSPVEFTRISSGFTLARFHPILHKWRAHRGVDYAAPMGARVKATAEGTVAYAGVQTGYGNVVVVQHRGRFSTLYGHLSRFAYGLHRGQHVAQGEVIGYVGKTGWATGPHLHYEFRVDGRPRNPANVAMPDDAMPISNEQRDAFLNATHDLSMRLRILHNISLAQTD